MDAPPLGTVERWAWDYVLTADAGHKERPPEPPKAFESGPVPRRLSGPGRPPGVRVLPRSTRTPSSLVHPEKRAQLLTTFLHHELQAAELMCWAVLAFPDTPVAFRRGLIGIALDEVRHMGFYAGHIERLGGLRSQLPVRDWFWERVAKARTPVEFVAVMGMGFEGGNLDHAERFARRFDDVGDPVGAELQRLVGREEIPHVRFALHWFSRFTGHDDFSTWVAHLPPPLSPLVMRGRPINRGARREARMSDAFIDALEAFVPSERGPV